MTLGAFDQTVGALPGGRASAAPPGPQRTGRDGGRDLNLPTLARGGVSLLVRLQGIHGHTLVFAADLREQIAAGDAAPLEHPPRFAEADAAAPATTIDIAAAAIIALI